MNWYIFQIFFSVLQDFSWFAYLSFFYVSLRIESDVWKIFPIYLSTMYRWRHLIIMKLFCSGLIRFWVKWTLITFTQLLICGLFKLNEDTWRQIFQLLLSVVKFMFFSPKFYQFQFIYFNSCVHVVLMSTFLFYTHHHVR